MIGRIALETVRLSAAAMPSPTPITTAISVATSTCESVSIASAQTPVTPIAPSITKVVIAGRSPETTNAISVSPSERGEPRCLDQELLQRQQQLLEDEDRRRLGDREDPRRRVLDVVEHALDAVEEPRLRA